MYISEVGGAAETASIESPEAAPIASKEASTESSSDFMALLLAQLQALLCVQNQAAMASSKLSQETIPQLTSEEAAKVSEDELSAELAAAALAQAPPPSLEGAPAAPIASSEGATVVAAIPSLSPIGAPAVPNETVGTGLAAAVQPLPMEAENVSLLLTPPTGANEAVDDHPMMLASRAVALLQAFNGAGLGENSIEPAHELRSPSSDPLKASAPLVSVGAADIDAASKTKSALSGAQPVEWTTLESVGRATVESVRYLVSQGERTFTVRLVPPSLGEIRIDVTQTQDTLNVRLIPASPAVRDMLDAHLPTLRQALGQDGIDMSRVVVTVDMGAGHTTPGFPGRHETPPVAPSSVATRHTYQIETSESAWTAPRAAYHDGALNVFV